VTARRNGRARSRRADEAAINRIPSSVPTHHFPPFVQAARLAVAVVESAEITPVKSPMHLGAVRIGTEQDAGSLPIRLFPIDFLKSSMSGRERRILRGVKFDLAEMLQSLLGGALGPRQSKQRAKCAVDLGLDCPRGTLAIPGPGTVHGRRLLRRPPNEPPTLRAVRRALSNHPHVFGATAIIPATLGSSKLTPSLRLQSDTRATLDCGSHPPSRTTRACLPSPSALFNLTFLWYRKRRGSPSSDSFQ
jgi:hypothetical protein